MKIVIVLGCTSHYYNFPTCITRTINDCPLARLMLGSAIVTANSTVCEIFIDDTIDKYSHTPCDKVTLKTIHGTHQVFTDKEKVKRANGITATIHYFIDEGVNRLCHRSFSFV